MKNVSPCVACAIELGNLKQEKEQIVISFRGQLNSDVMDTLLIQLETKLLEVEESLKIRKKVFYILVECLQNMHHHSLISSENEGAIPIGEVAIIKGDSFYRIITKNTVENNLAENLRSKLDEMNSLSNDELKGLYSKVLSEGSFSQKGGAGLGIIDIARKSGQQLEYQFVPDDEFNSLFSLTVKVQ